MLSTEHNRIEECLKRCCKTMLYGAVEIGASLEEVQVGYPFSGCCIFLYLPRKRTVSDRNERKKRMAYFGAQHFLTGKKLYDTFIAFGQSLAMAHVFGTFVLFYCKLFSDAETSTKQKTILKKLNLTDMIWVYGCFYKRRIKACSYDV